MSRYNRCNECYNMKCVFVTGERTDFDSSECADFRPMTNADRIRSMTDDELAEWMAINTDCFFCKVKNKNICSLDEGTCTEEWLSWLKSPVEEGEG